VIDWAREGFVINERYQISKHIYNQMVWEAIDLRDNSHVAIKIVRKRKNLLKAHTKILMNELNNMNKIPVHTNIINLYEIIETDQEILYVMELLPMDLMQYLNSHGRMKDSHDLYLLFIQMLEAITHCHRNFIAHRDIKLENFLIDSNNVIKLIDFVHSVDVEKQKIHVSMCGSIVYSSPAIIEGKPYDPLHEDVWSLGICLYTMVCGRFPFYSSVSEKTTIELIKKEPLRFPNDLSPQLIDLIVLMLKRNRKNRITMEGIWNHPFIKINRENIDEKQNEVTINNEENNEKISQNL